MNEAERAEFMEQRAKPYLAANGHTMVVEPQWSGGRPVFSSAFARCVDNCAACSDGELLPDW